MIKQATFNEMKKPESAVLKDFNQFVESGWDCCEVDTSRYKTVASAVTAYRSFLYRNNYPVKVTQRGGKVYLILKKD